MATSRLHQKSALVAAAMAASATGLFVAAGPAQALPPLPLAPAACQQWNFTGTTVVQMGTGETMVFQSTKENAFDAPASWSHPEGATDKGTVSAQTGNGAVTLVWNEEKHMMIIFEGEIGPDGSVSGTRPGTDGTVPWQITTPLFCAVKGDAGGPQGNSREVTGDVEVYDVPGGVGTVIGTLEGGDGQRVQLGSGCKEDHWCNVSWPAGPGGTAWVWGDFLK